jgi:hypothetical protein
MEVIPFEHAQFLYWISWIGLPVGIVGIYYGNYFLGTGVCIGSFLAQTYWSDPKYDWIRILDISWIQVLIWTHLWWVWASPVRLVYCIIQIMGALFYVVSWCYMQDDLLISTICHAMVHICANISLLVFYFSSKTEQV